jgi:hypothetical protein
MRKTERLTKQQVAAMSGTWDNSSTGKMLEVARRQGLITSSFELGPNGERKRLYHSWEYKETDTDFVEVPETVAPHDFF